MNAGPANRAVEQASIVAALAAADPPVRHTPTGPECTLCLTRGRPSLHAARGDTIDNPDLHKLTCLWRRARRVMSSASTVDYPSLRAAATGPHRPYLEVRYQPFDARVDLAELVTAIDRLIDAVIRLTYDLADIDDIPHRQLLHGVNTALRHLGLNANGRPALVPLEATA